MAATPKLRLLWAMFGLIVLASAAKPTSFCKCTCFTNSTIIPLDAHITEPASGSGLLFSRSPESEEKEPQEPVPDPPPEGEEKDDPESDDKVDEAPEKNESRPGTCSDCTRQFCLDYNLPICKKAEIEDVYTTCFQRDSRKDEAVVFIFIIATAGLLSYAAVKPWISSWVNAARERSSYIPVSSGET